MNYFRILLKISALISRIEFEIYRVVLDFILFHIIWPKKVKHCKHKNGKFKFSNNFWKQKFIPY